MKTKKLNENKGVTLTALIIAIIVLIILASISITSINGQRSAIEEAQEAKISAEVATYQEELDIIEIKTVAEQINEGLDDEGYINAFKERTDADEVFDEAEKTIKHSGDEVYLRIITEEGYVFDVYPDEIIYRGIGYEGGEDLTEDDVTFACDPSDWTNESVTVTVELNIDTDSTLQYSVDGSTWETYTSSGITVTTNGKVYVRLLNSDGLYGDSVDYSVGNIDTLAPNSFTITVTEGDDESVTISGSTTDADATSTSGSSGIVAYYFSCDGGETWVPSGGTSDTSYTFEDLESGTTYTFAIKAVDEAGNEKIATTEWSRTLPPADITFSYNTKDWTNGNVAVTASTSSTGYTIQMSEDGETYTDTTTLTYTKNGTVYARLSDGRNYGETVQEEIDWIDKTDPIVTSAQTTTNKISISATDEEDGSGIVGYAITQLTSDPGEDEFTAVDATYSLTISVSGFTQTETYYVWVIDQAGNISDYKEAKTGTVDPADGIITLEYDPAEDWTNESVTVTAIVTGASDELSVQMSYTGEDSDWEETTSLEFSSNRICLRTIMGRL